MNIAIFHDGGSKFWMPLADHWRSLGHEVRAHANYSHWDGWIRPKNFELLNNARFHA